VERAVILSHGPLVEPEDLGIAVKVSDAAPLSVGSPVSIEALEREHIARVVLASPTLESAARILGIDATTLQRKRRRYGLA